MKLLSPQALPYNFDDWVKQPFHIRAQMVCQAWAIQGYGAPPAVYSFYLLKIIFYIWMWTWFASFSTELGSLSSIGSWWFKPEALLKAIAWSMLFEGLGLASGSGPLTARYSPPFGGFLYWLRPGTLKFPFRPGMPWVGGDTRRWIDNLLYLLHIVQLVRVLVAPEVTPAVLWPTAVILLLMGLTDRTMFLASRPEHYLIGLICFLFPQDALPAAKWVWYGIWFWAATSKLNRHFPSVISVMISNSAVIRLPALRKRLFRSFPDDLRASKLAINAAHLGTVTEYLFPFLLMFGVLLGGNLFDLGTPATVIGLALMLGFHTFITSNVPMAVPIEWNFMMVYGGFVLFGHHAAISPFTIQSPLLIGLLIIALMIIPLAGNLYPAWVSFLMAMRFYAGNWAYSIWLFKDEAEEKITKYVTTSAPLLPKQLSLLYDDKTIEGILSRVISFRLMHLHGRLLHDLLPKAVSDIDRYVWRDGELVCGVVLGWNFGDGHLHNEYLLASLQKRCQWESEEVRVIFVDPQPLGKPHLDWRIFDAKDGQLDKGRISIDELVDRQPFPIKPIHG
jgi:hypothetical protein